MWLFCSSMEPVVASFGFLWNDNAAIILSHSARWLWAWRTEAHMYWKWWRLEKKKKRTTYTLSWLVSCSNMWEKMSLQLFGLKLLLKTFPFGSFISAWKLLCCVCAWGWALAPPPHTQLQQKCHSSESEPRWKKWYYSGWQHPCLLL